MCQDLFQIFSKILKGKRGGREGEIKVQLTDAAVKLVADEAYEPSFGARPLKRYLQKNVETLMAREILGDKVRAGDTIIIDNLGGKLGIM